MNLEGILTAIVAGAIGLSFASVILQPQGAAAAVISATADGFSGILNAAKANPGTTGAVPGR